MSSQDDTERPRRETLEDMTFWDHVDALRATLIRIVAVVVVLSFAYFAAMPYIFDNVILAPCRGDFVLYRLFQHITDGIPGLPQFSTEGFHVNLINYKLASQFFIHMSSSLWFAVVTAFPIIVWQLWLFIKPALYENERRGSGMVFTMGTVMFFLGVAVGYFVVFPVTLRFLAEYQVSEMIPNQISLESYMDNFLMIVFMMGIVFEMPLLAWLLSFIGILRRSFFSRFRRHAIVVLLIIAAVITPTGDPFTLSIVFLPLYILYEVSALIVKKD